MTNILSNLDFGVIMGQPKGDEERGTCDVGAPISGTLINNGNPKRKFSYLLTIKCHAMAHVSKSELDAVLAETVKKVNASKLKADWSTIVAYEEDSVGRMHIHTHLVTEKAIFMKKYQKPGWSIHFQDRKDGHSMTGARALSYMTKQDQGKYAVEQRFDENYYRYNNRF